MARPKTNAGTAYALVQLPTPCEPGRHNRSFGPEAREEVTRQSSCRQRGICAQCSRPYELAAFGDGFVIVSCRNGHLELAKRGSKLYARARSYKVGKPPNE